jgi:succinate-semialdehyde dehydrogenase/glutarate-semialdehyde dehydrogenase
MTTTSYVTLGHHIGGEWLEQSSGGTLEVFNPATGELLASMPKAGEDEVGRALEAAARGFAVWRRTDPAKRCEIILRAARLVRERELAIARVMTLEQGKPLGEARSEVIRSAELIEWAAEEGRRTYGLTIPAPADHRYLTFMEPIGAVAALTPWNFPAVSPARKVGSSLAAGCSCILKPSEQTPGTAVALVQAFVDAGLPAGVLNLVLGDPDPISRQLIASPVIRKLTFTGSVAVGKHLARLAAEQMKPCLMELGGHAPTIVFADADVARVAKASVTAKFRNAGQICTSPTRFYVQADAYDAFTREFSAGCRSLTVGDGLAETTKVGPLASRRRVDAIESLVSEAQERGATILAGGARGAAAPATAGYFFEPTALGEVPLEARVMREEPFGPVAAFRRFTTVQEVLEQANGLPFGLASYVFTGSIRTAREMASGLDCGIVGVNSFSGSNPETPFGGVKDSGYGREGGTEGVRAYMSTKFVVEGVL